MRMVLKENVQKQIFTQLITTCQIYELAHAHVCLGHINWYDRQIRWLSSEKLTSESVLFKDLVYNNKWDVLKTSSLSVYLADDDGLDWQVRIQSQNQTLGILLSRRIDDFWQNTSFQKELETIYFLPILSHFIFHIAHALCSYTLVMLGDRER